MKRVLTAIAICISLLSAIPASADLTGTQVTTTWFATGAPFYGPTTATIGPGIEFSVSNGNDTLNADFDANSLTIHFFGGDTFVQPLVLDFTSLTPGAFSGISTISDGFPSTNSISVANNTITWNWDSGGAFFRGPDYTATYAITSSTPEPATFLLFTSGLLIPVLRRRRKSL